MYKRAAFLFTFILVFLTIRVYPQAGFFKAYGKTPQDYFYSLAKTLDGGYILSGISNGYGGSNYLFLVKTDANGDTTWMRGYVTTNTVFGWSVVACSDSGFAVCGNSGYAKVDKKGNMLWSNVFTLSSLYSIKETPDKGFIITGSVGQSNQSNGQDVYLLKTDSNGTKQWSRKLGGPQDEYANSVQLTNDGGYILAGATESFGAGGYDVYVIKTTASGDTLWTKTYGGALTEGGIGSSRVVIATTLDGGYIVGGYSNSFATAGGLDAYVIKLDAVGTIEWDRLYGGTGNDQVFDIRQCADSGYVFAGYTGSSGTGNDIFLAKLNAFGDTLFTRAYGAANSDYGQQIVETADKGFVLCGYTTNFGSGNNDGAFLKVDSLGNAACHQFNVPVTFSDPATVVGNTTTGKIYITLNMANSTPVGKGGGNVVDACIAIGVQELANLEFDLFPNPTTGSIVFTSSQNEDLLVTVSDILGNVVFAKTFSGATEKKELDLNAIPAGTYFFRVENELYSDARKLFIIK